MTADQRVLRFKFDWKLTVLTAVLLPLMVSLGFWQLDRAEEKGRLQQEFNHRQAAAPVALQTVDPNSDMRYLKVSLAGNYDNDRYWLLDNRVYQGRPGYEIISLFKLVGHDLTVLVNRGWVEGSLDRTVLPAVDSVSGTVSLQGEVYVPAGKPYSLGKEPASAQWPRVVQWFDPVAAKQVLDGNVFPFIVRISAASPGAYKANWVVVNISPEKHRAYAFQWFAMSVALVIIYFSLSTNIAVFFKRYR